MQALKIIAGLSGALVVVFFACGFYLSSQPESIGRHACEDRIRLCSKDPTTVDFGVPRFDPGVQPDRDRYSWDPSSLRMKNGFGAMLGATAVCTVDKSSRKVVDLQLR